MSVVCSGGSWSQDWSEPANVPISGTFSWTASAPGTYNFSCSGSWSGNVVNGSTATGIISVTVAYATPTLTASPNPIPVPTGATVGSSTISYSAPGRSSVALHQGSTQVACCANSNSFTFNNITNGTVFTLIDTTTSNTIASLTVTLTNTGPLQLQLSTITSPTSVYANLGGATNLTVSSVSSGSLVASQTHVYFGPTCNGTATGSASVGAVRDLIGQTWRITEITLPTLTSPGTYALWTNGTTSSGAEFVTSRCSSVIVFYGYTVSGTVKTSSGSLLPGGYNFAVTGCPQYAICFAGTSNGSLLGDLAAGATYTITPQIPGIAFSPPSVTLPTLNSNQTLNFTATTENGKEYIYLNGRVVAIETQ